MRTLTGHKDKALTVNFSSDNNTIVSCSCDRTIKLWRGYDQFGGYSTDLISIDFSTDGQRIAIASEDGTVKLWDNKGKLQQNLLTDNSEIVDVKFNPVGGTIATGCKDSTVKLLSLKGELLETKVIPSNEDHELRNISFSPDGTLMAIASNDGTVKLWHPGDDVIKVLQQHESGVNRVTFSPCGKKIASASRDATVIVWNLDGTIYRTLKGHKSGVYDAEFSPDGEIIATFSTDGVKIWHLQESSPKPLDINEQNDILALKFIDNKMLALVMNNQTFQLWNIEEGKLVQSRNIEGKEVYINLGRFNANGSAIAIANLEPKIKLCLLDLDELMNNSRTWISDYLGLQK